MASIAEASTALYRHFDSDDKLLYVGVSFNPIVRLSQHRQAAEWFRRLARSTVEWFPSREAALAAERAAIEGERPEFNVTYNARKPDPTTPAEKVVEVDLGPMPWGPRGRPFYEGEKPCPSELQTILYRDYL